VITAPARRRLTGRGIVVIADYGAGNPRSVVSAFARANAETILTTDARVVEEAALAVVAGVGHLARTARGLDDAGLSDALRARAARGRPVLGICVGMQIFFGASEEGGRGLGLLPGRVVRIRASRVPHMGWNTLALTRRTPLLDGLDGADVYFAHSYVAVPHDPAVVAATTDHDGLLVAAVAHDAVAGVQFHPERSGAAGARLLANALRWSRSA
jgi:imidazole glycerol-phosphate synthase subunit HisH